MSDRPVRLLLAVDDEYVIVGSANLNERSLAGNRDSEIAQGSYQPAHLNGPCGRARGQVHGFRMSLWHEHEHFMARHAGEGGGDDDRAVFLEPESVECVRAVRRVAERLWNAGQGGEPAGPPAAVPDNRVGVRRGGRPAGGRLLPGHEGAGEGEESAEAS